MNRLRYILVVLMTYCILALQIHAKEVSNNEKSEQEISLLRNEVKKLKKDKLKLKKDKLKLSEELAVHKPQNLPKMQQSDIDNKHFNTERIFRLRSANCFDFNGDMSCMYQILKLDNNRIGYLLYKANRVFDSNTKIGRLIDKEGRLLNILTSEDAKKIRKWEKNNSDLLILLMTY